MRSKKNAGAFQLRSGHRLGDLRRLICDYGGA